MKLYRAIEFSKLSFILSEFGRGKWDETVEEFKISESQHTNWWFDENFKPQIKYILADIIKNAQDSFFQNSLTYNSVVGGRYNPPNSFGILYTSTNPTLSALEVLFHIYNNKRKYLQSMAKNSEGFSTTFDKESPTSAKNLIVVFTIEFDPEKSSVTDCVDSERLRNLITKVGFERYTSGEDFDDDFIFGNNYEVSRILGCHLNANNDSKACYFRSARIENCVDSKKLFNVVFPETYVQDNGLALLPEYYLIESSVEIQEQNGIHDVILKILGNSEINGKIGLEKYLDEKKVKTNERLREYRPRLPEDLQPHLNKRRVLFQRFRDNTSHEA